MGRERWCSNKALCIVCIRVRVLPPNALHVHHMQLLQPSQRPAIIYCIKGASTAQLQAGHFFLTSLPSFPSLTTDKFTHRKPRVQEGHSNKGRMTSFLCLLVLLAFSFHRCHLDHSPTHSCPLPIPYSQTSPRFFFPSGTVPGSSYECFAGH